jgi:hypothetical protein
MRLGWQRSRSHCGSNGQRRLSSVLSHSGRLRPGSRSSPGSLLTTAAVLTRANAASAISPAVTAATETALTTTVRARGIAAAAATAAARSAMWSLQHPALRIYGGVAPSRIPLCCSYGWHHRSSPLSHAGCMRPRPSSSLRSLAALVALARTAAASATSAAVTAATVTTPAPIASARGAATAAVRAAVWSLRHPVLRTYGRVA